MDNDTYANLSVYEMFNNKTYTVEDTEFDFLADAFVRWLHRYYTPFVIILGVIGNMLCPYVFFTSRLKIYTSSYYLSALAVSDSVFLLLLLPPWLELFHKIGFFHYRGFCQAFVYKSYVTSCISAWLVMSFTLERFVAVVYPLRCNVIYSVKRTRIIIVCIVAAAIILNIPILRFAVPMDDDCMIDRQYIAQAARFNLVDTVLSFSIPLVTISCINLCIMGVLYKREQQPDIECGQATRQGIRPIRMAGCTRSQQKVTRMLLIVSTVFVTLNLPAYAMRVVAYSFDMDFENSSLRWKALQQLVLLLFDTNFGINFFLYCLCAQNFRDALKASFPFLRRNAREETTVRRAAAFRLANCNSTTSLSTAGVASQAPTCHIPRRCPNRGRYIAQWTFDNSRQRAAREAARLAAQSFEEHTL